MRNLIFDFDGVIGDTWDAILHGLIMTGRETDKESAITNMRIYTTNKPPYANGHSLTDEELDAEFKWNKKFGRFVHEHGFELFEEFVKEIERLDNCNKAIVSSGSREYLLPAIAKTNINPTHILAFEDHNSKEEKIKMVCQDWGVTTDDVYYFTDSLADVYELRDLISRDKLIGVSWGYCSRDQLLTELDDSKILNTPGDIGFALTSC